MQTDYELNLYTPVALGTPAAALSLTEYLTGWRRSIRLQGGCWLGSGRIYGPLADLRQMFAELLGFHLEERSRGLLTWSGMIYEMRFVYKGNSRRRTLDLLSNAVKAVYTDANNQAAETAWATDSKAIARYGRREEILQLSGYPSTAVTARRDVFLKENAWPWARAEALGAGEAKEAPYIDLKVCGYAFPANWRYVTSADLATGNANAWITAILSADCATFLTAGSISTNTLQIKRILKTPQRAWEKIASLADLGDASANPWRAWVDQSRRVHYAQVSNTVQYYWRGNELVDINDARVLGWQALPGVVRDVTYPVSRTEPGSPFLLDARDVLVDEIEAAQGGLALKTKIFAESEILAAQQAFRQMEDDQEPGTDPTRPSRRSWKDRLKRTPGWERMTPAERRARLAQGREGNTPG